MSAGAFFRRLGEGRFEQTEHARGPWSPEHAHGGPPSALLTRALEEVAAAGTHLARVQVQLWRPVSLGAVRVSARVEREGRTVRGLVAELHDDGGALLATATALGLREAEVVLPPRAEESLPFAPPEECSVVSFPFFGAEVGYHTSMDLRFSGGGFGQGWADAWLRMRVALVEGELPSPLQRVMVAADSGNGISMAVPHADYTFINPDLTVTTYRPLAGEWVGMRSVTRLAGEGVGLAESLLLDPEGAIGRGVQTLVVRARAGRGGS